MRFWLLPLLLLLCCFDVQAARMDMNCEDHQDDDLTSLACNIYWEARTEDYMGMLAVAAATLWRTQDPEFPHTIAGVVWEKRWSKRHGRYYPQFQWTLDGKKDRPFATPEEQEKWRMAMRIASMFAVSKLRKDAMCKSIEYTQRMWDMLEEMGHPVKRRELRCAAYDLLIRSKIGILADMDPTDGAVMYHAVYAKPVWRRSPQLMKVGAVGRHIFYRKVAQ